MLSIAAVKMMEASIASAHLTARCMSVTISSAPFTTKAMSTLLITTSIWFRCGVIRAVKQSGHEDRNAENRSLAITCFGAVRHRVRAVDGRRVDGT